MTIRLVALMSVVLLLSLAAFGLTVQHYQRQVMLEVADTVSEVGRATLRTLELEGEADLGEALGSARERRMMVWAARPEPTGERPTAEPDREVREERFAHRSEHEEAGRPRLRVVASKVQLEGEAAISESVRCETDPETGEESCVATDEGIPLDAARRFVIMVDDVHAEADPHEGLVLKIPRLAPRRGAGAVQVVDPSTAQTAGTSTWIHQEEIRLPIPVAEFESLFGALRRRSLGVFLGVFLVGSVLSAGLASRFTRPVRRLDAAIRRLSEGDLAVQVETHGRDEIARLGRGFNEMTRSLRASRQRAREMLRREKHSALGRLAAGVAHDVRNPLHSIGLTLQHLSETCRPADRERASEFDRSLEMIRGEIRRLDKLVGNFLDFATSEVHERHPVDLRELLRETARLVRKEAEWRRVELALELDDAVPALEADGEAIRSSVLNLVLNSFEAMPDGGTLTLALRVQDGQAIVEVRDTGRGIPSEDRERVFDFAFTTREGGNGLGLAMVYQCIVEDHGGRVSLDSTPGRGTQVTLALPLPPRQEGDG